MTARTFFKARQGDWQLHFDPANSTLACQHIATGARVTGNLSFEAIIEGRAEVWTASLPRDAVAGRLSLIDAQGNVQGYLAPSVQGAALRLLVLHRTAQSYRGRLAFAGRVVLGKSTFACRTRADTRSKVVQMASGPADSALNDSLFDIKTDTLLRFSAKTVAITTEDGLDQGRQRFHVELTALPHEAEAAELVFDVEQNYYRSRYVPYYRALDKAHCPSPPTGWMSWNVYFDAAGERKNLDEARVGAKHLRPFGLEIWSIESWQENSDRQPVSVFCNLNLKPHPGQFPHGMKWLAQQIRELGLKPGIWTVPFGTGEKAFYETHRDWFLHDADGNPMSNWNGRYVLDPSQPEVRRYLTGIYRIMSRNWGYGFFKIDGISGRFEHYSAHFFERDEVRQAFRFPCPNPMERCLRALRRGIGEDRIFLACQGHYTGPEVAVADAARIGGDIVSANEPPTWHNILSQADSTLNQLFIHNIVWYNDPDTLLVGTFHSLAIARVATTIVALPGQVTFAGDKLAELPRSRMRLLQQSLPVCDVRPLDLFPIFDRKSVWALKIRRDCGSWDVVSLFNWDDNGKKIGFRFDEIGLPGNATYLLYDFWRRRFLGAHEGEFWTRVAPRSNRLLTVHPALGRPQFLSSDRHITQGGVCLKALDWDEAAGVLSGTVHLVEKSPVRLTFFVPAPYEFRSATAEHATVLKATVKPDRTVVITLRRKETGEAHWRLNVGAVRRS